VSTTIFCLDIFVAALDRFSSEEGQWAQEELQHLVYAISHDMGAPLRAVVSFAQIMKEKYAHTLDDEGQSYLAFIVEGGEKAQAMLAGLLQYSRVETQAKPFASVDMAPLAAQALTTLRSTIEATKATIEVGTLPSVMGDAAQLLQLFTALLDNALKFHTSGSAPRIGFTAEQEEGLWKFRMEDNGIGIAPEHRARIFELFKRLHSNEEYPGVGVGLTLARKIIRHHGGDMGVEASPSGGCCFYFTLPAEEV
jgi:light-regulated signal transduction histidine kinase (bacteriophytochrome)